MEKQSQNLKTVRLSLESYNNLILLQHYTFNKRKFTITKKALLGWTINKALQEIIEYEKQK